jgi:uncharacterized protein with PQ loop repeat
MFSAEETLLPIANVAESFVPILSLLAYIPQWRHLLQTRDSRGISLASWGIWALAYTISIFYAAVLLKVTGKGLPLLMGTIFGLLFVLTTMILAWRFRRSPESQEKK